jgi:hypothetical protein
MQWLWHVRGVSIKVTATADAQSKYRSILVTVATSASRTLNHAPLSANSGFRRDADEICALVGYYAELNGNPLPTFRDKVSVPFSRVKKSKKKLTLEDRADSCPETSVKDYDSTLRNTPQERSSHAPLH